MTAIRVDGATRLYAIVGDPIVQVKSPEVFSELFARAGMNAVMIPMHVLPERFEESMRALMGIANVDGLVATVPYKAQAVQFADRLGPTASRIRALNALRREPDGTWTGDMFDGLGFVRAFERWVSNHCRSSIHGGSAQRHSLKRFAVRFRRVVSTPSRRCRAAST